jgi:hypothetical protein
VKLFATRVVALTVRPITDLIFPENQPKTPIAQEKIRGNQQDHLQK